MAYAQLVILRRSYPKRLPSNVEELFHGLSLEELCEKALENGSDIPSVLMQCGITMRRIDINTSIEFLRKSVDMKPTSPAYHHLGISYKQKAQQLTNRNIFHFPESINDESQHNDDQYVEQDMSGGSYEALGPSRQAHDVPTGSSDHSVNYQRRMRDDDINYGTSYTYSEMNHKCQHLGDESECVNHESLYLPNSHRKRHRVAETSETTTAKRARYQEWEYADHDNTEEAHNVFRNRSSITTDEFQDSATCEGYSNNVQPLNSEPRRECYERSESYDDEHIYEQGRGNSDTQINKNRQWKHGNARDSPRNDGDERGSHWRHRNPRGSQYWDSNPRGSQYRDSNPRGSQYWHSNPRGSQYWHSNPRGSQYRDSNPRGSQYSDSYPRSSQYRDNNPRGSQYRDNNPRDTGHNRNKGTRRSGRNKRNNVHLSMDDENVKQARDCFQKAIDIAKENYPAAIDLGLLLKEANQIHEALQQFNSITDSYAPSISHTATVISAYEQAGLCYLQLNHTDGRDNNEEIGKRKLVKAISRAASLVHIMPELQGNLESVWMALKSCVTRIGKKQIYCSSQPKRNILELAKKYKDTIRVIQKLNELGEGGLGDYVLIKERLHEYLKSNQPETALAFQNLVAINPDVKNSDWWETKPGEMLALRIKVLLLAISERLRAKSDNPTFLFQQIFELVFGSCHGLCDPESDQQTDVPSGLVGDVLFLFDTGDGLDKDVVYPTVKAASCLKMLTATLFGLEVDENMKGCVTYSDSVIEKQLNRMKEYHAVVIVLGNEKRSKDFQAVLRRLKENPTDPMKHKILIIDAGIKGSHIPITLKKKSGD